MLPSSSSSSYPKINNSVKIDNISTLGDIDRYYKKNDVNKSINATKTKIVNPGNPDKNNNDLYEITPPYIESIISDSTTPYQEKEDEYEDKYNNGLSIKKHKMTNIKYPFSSKSSHHITYDMDNIYDDVYKNSNVIGGESTDMNERDILVEFLIYYINTSSYKPFLEFMLYKSSDEKDNNKLYFPNFSHDVTSSTIVENSSLLLDNIFGNDSCEFKGRIIESPTMNPVKSAYINNRVILLYNLKKKSDTVFRYTSSDLFWWCTVSELLNYRKVLFYDISDTVTDVFIAYPEALKLYHKQSLVETPIVAFNGSDKKNAKYNAVFSIRKSNNESRYGPYYYFTDLYNAMRYACYNNETREKYDLGGLVRFVIFPGKMKMFLKKNKPDRSEMAKFICEKYPIEKKTIQFRDNDCTWTEEYNSSYNGKYEFAINSQIDSYLSENSDNNETNKKSLNYSGSVNDSSGVADYIPDQYSSSSSSSSSSDIISDVKYTENIYYLAMRICIREYNFQTPLSYYYIDTVDIPNNYEYDFKKYKII